MLFAALLFPFILFGVILTLAAERQRNMESSILEDSQSSYTISSFDEEIMVPANLDLSNVHTKEELDRAMHVDSRASSNTIV